jgi:hypothetical protein
VSGKGGGYRLELGVGKPLLAEQSRAEQSRAEQSRAEQSRAEQSRAEQSRAEQSRTSSILRAVLCLRERPWLE